MVTAIVQRVSKIMRFQLRGRNVIASAPQVDLLFTEFVSSLFLVQSSERSVVTFVESPSLRVRNPKVVHLIRDNVVSDNRACQQ